MSPAYGEREDGPDGLERVLFCFAVEQEAKFVSQKGMELLITGIGRENAERRLHAALKREPYQLVLSCGFAGGLNPYLTTGTVVFATDEDAGLTPALLAAGACPVRFHCADRVAATVAEKRHLWESTGGCGGDGIANHPRDLPRARNPQRDDPGDLRRGERTPPAGFQRLDDS